MNQLRCSYKLSVVLTWIFVNICFDQISRVQAKKQHHHTCHFSRLYGNKKVQPGPNDKPDITLADEQQMLNSGNRDTARILQAAVRNTIRITLDTNDFNTIKTTLNGQSQTTATNLAFVKKAMLVVQTFFQKRLKVSTMSRIFAPSLCVDFNPSSNDVSNGISASDLHIYVRYITDKRSTYGYSATGKSCKYVTSRSLPDPTLQQGRPTVGRIIFNTYNTVDRQTSLTNRLFAEITATALHETIHIIGFDSTLYDTYIDSGTYNVYPSPIYQSVTLNAARTGGDNYILKTPQVTDWAQRFFACADIVGMALQNQETTPGVGSHWERLSMYDELMTGTQLGAQKGLSGLTFSLLKDMGWYEVQGAFNDTSNFGYQLGCGFFFNACYDSTPQPKYWCEMATYTGVSTCATNFLSKAVCTSTSAMTDSCGIVGGYFHCVDPAQSDDGYKSYTLQKYQVSAFCVQSTFANIGLTDRYRGRCYPYKCYASYIQFYVDVYTVTCQSNEGGTRKTLTSLSGYLECPEFVDFCQQSRKICKNWCSQNGFCMRGICNCLPGYYGADCSKTTCTSTQYYDQINSTCTTACGSGTYLNKFSSACLPCNSPCDECRDEPTICTGCLSTPTQRKYFFVSNSSCEDSCPTITYVDGDYCRDCDPVVFCGTCQYDPQNCTSCTDGYFLENPFFGNCVSSCTGTYSIYDAVNFKCVSGCSDNLIYYADSCTVCPNPTDGNCNLCANGTYKYIGDQSCHTNCPSRYYQNEDRRFCERCHSSCKQCNGGYAENCTQCLSSSNYKYLLLSHMCVAKCPSGFFANDDTNTCEVCIPSLNCATCTKDVTNAVICQTCQYNFYLQQNNTCLSGCDEQFFKNTWNHTCDRCNPQCLTCTAGSVASCLECPLGRYFMANISGRYCLGSCPPYFYFVSTNNCLDCYSTCRACNGSNSDDCLICISGLYLSDGMCRYVCPSHTYPDKQNGRCRDCHDDCTFCFGPTVDNCTACGSGLVLNNFTCTTSCPEGLTVNQWGVCYQGFWRFGWVWIGMLLVTLFGY